MSAERDYMLPNCVWRGVRHIVLVHQGGVSIRVWVVLRASPYLCVVQ